MASANLFFVVISIEPSRAATNALKSTLIKKADVPEYSGTERPNHDQAKRGDLPLLEGAYPYDPLMAF
jgi:hypothetical protein